MPGGDVGGLLRSAVAAFGLAAGVLHLSAAADHRGMGGHVAFFLLVALAQSLLAPILLLAGRPGRWLAVAAGTNLAVAGVWAASRTTGLPVDGSSVAEAVGFKDTVTTLLELGAVAAAGFWWLLPPASRQVALESRRLASVMLGTGVWAFGAAGLFAGHTHSAGHTHGGGQSHETAHSTAGQLEGHDHPVGTEVGTAPAHDHHLAGSPPAGADETAGHDHATHAPLATGAPEPEHDHGHGGAAPVPRTAAAHHGAAHHGSADHPAAYQVDHHPADGGPAHSPDHSHGAEPAPESHHHSPDQGHERSGDDDQDDDEGSRSPLDEVLKLIQPR